jgi:hypothetical protein
VRVPSSSRPDPAALSGIPWHHNEAGKFELIVDPIGARAHVCTARNGCSGSGTPSFAT